MNTISPYHQNTAGQLDFSASSYSDRMLTQASVSQQQNKNITIFTEDGDKVTISSGLQSQAFYSNYFSFTNEKVSGSYGDHTVNQNRSTSLQEERLGYESSRHLSISVDGNLSEQEMKDVRETIKAIDRIMIDLLYGGDITEGLASVLHLVDRDSISGILANYSYRNAISVEHTNTEEISTYSKDGLIESVKPVISNESDYIAALIDEMINMITDSIVKPSNMIDPIEKLFYSLLKDLFNAGHPDKSKISLAKLIEAELIDRIKQIPERSEFPINPSS